MQINVSRIHVNESGGVIGPMGVVVFRVRGFIGFVAS